MKKMFSIVSIQLIITFSYHQSAIRRKANKEKMSMLVISCWFKLTNVIHLWFSVSSWFGSNFFHSKNGQTKYVSFWGKNSWIWKREWYNVMKGFQIMTKINEVHGEGHASKSTDDGEIFLFLWWKSLLLIWICIPSLLSLVIEEVLLCQEKWPFLAVRLSGEYKFGYCRFWLLIMTVVL